jgi:serine/threonine protein kinase/TolB-like protein
VSESAGQKIGRYAILSRVGAGATGTVYRALDPTIGRTVALKVIPAQAEADATHEERSPELASARLFQREAQAAGALLHPNIVTLYDAGRDGDKYYLAMEFVEGETLAAALARDGRFPVARAIEAMAIVCDAIDFAHERGIVHRDLKPANLILLPDGTVKVADFGIARLASIGAPTSVTASIIAGTPSYMSPEQIRGAAVDRRSDVFSLGVVLYELVTGQKPFRADGVVATMNMILTQAPKPPRELSAEVTPELSAAVLHALEKEPGRRFATARDLAAELRAERLRLEERQKAIAPPEETPQPPAERTATGGTSPDVFVLEDVVKETPSRFPRRSLLWLAAAAVLLLLLRGLWGRSPDTTPQDLASSAPTAAGGGARARSPAGGISPAPVAPVAAAAAASPRAQEPRVSLGVMLFKPLDVDTGNEWMREALRDGLNARLSGLSEVKVYSKEYIDFLINKKGLTELEAATQLGIRKMLSGSYLAVGGMVQIEMHTVDVSTGVLDSSFTLVGRDSEFFDLQNRIALDLVARLDLPVSDVERRALEAPQVTDNDRLRLLLESEGNAAPAAADGVKPEGKAGKEPLSSEPRRGPALALASPVLRGASQLAAAMLAPPPACAAQTGEDEPVERNAILALIERYRHATEANEIATLASVYSAFSPAQQAAQQTYFTSVRNLKVSVVDVDVTIAGDDAIASYTRTDDFVDARTGRPMHISVRLTKNLKREGGVWKITAKN